MSRISGRRESYKVRKGRKERDAARNRELVRQVQERTNEIERQRQVAEGLREMLAVLNTDQPVGDVLSYIVSQACRLLASDAGVLYRFDFANSLSFAEAEAGMPAAFEGLGPFPIPDSAPQRAVQHGRAYATPDLAPYLAQAREESARWPAPLRSWLEVIARHFRARLAVPLIIKGQTYGAIELYYRVVHSFSPEELDLALSFSNQAALAIENARLRTQVKESAAAAERSRLARELHDAVSQTLFSASLIADVLPRLLERNPEEGRRRLNELRELTRGALAEMRTLLLELRPAVLAEAALADLLQQLAESVTGRARIPVVVGTEEACDVPPEVKVALYRIAQEALNNVVKHAQAHSASVSLRCAADEVCLDIEDDGSGFDVESITPEHLGVGIMRERAAAIGARLEIQSGPDEGTWVRVVWRPG